AAAGLPVEAPRVGAGRAMSLMRMDKKVLAGAVRVVLLRSLGAAEVTADYPGKDLEELLAEHFG
ncbi:MAG: 3-dehydroquinate synthase, partial [Gammaproteobacteria bacterium]|nr:3-dehydroquinate synthase [Gammaproteobacteria bacterium]